MVGEMNMNEDFLVSVIAIGLFVLILFVLVLPFAVINDISWRAFEGNAIGIISYQEKGGMFNLERVCWRDTINSGCEMFYTQNLKLKPGEATIEYICHKGIAWAWESISTCEILNVMYE